MKKLILTTGVSFRIQCLVHILIIWSFVFLLPSCGGKDEKTTKTGVPSGPFYRFIPGENGILDRAVKLDIPQGLNRWDILKALANDLARTYFLQNPAGEKTEIRFDLVSVSEMESAGQVYSVAVINLVDPREAAMNYFFQGSYGARETHAMILSSLFQPQTRPPLVDGLIFQYNGKTFPELDHIHFSGIVLPGPVSAMAKSAISNASGTP